MYMHLSIIFVWIYLHILKERRDSIRIETHQPLTYPYPYNRTDTDSSRTFNVRIITKLIHMVTFFFKDVLYVSAM